MKKIELYLLLCIMGTIYTSEKVKLSPLELPKSEVLVDSDAPNAPRLNQREGKSVFEDKVPWRESNGTNSTSGPIDLISAKISKGKPPQRKPSQRKKR